MPMAQIIFFTSDDNAVLGILFFLQIKLSLNSQLFSFRYKLLTKSKQSHHRAPVSKEKPEAVYFSSLESAEGATCSTNEVR